MHKNRRMALFVAANVDGETLLSLPREPDRWYYDVRLPRDVQVDNSLFAANDLDRAQLTNRRSVSWGDPSTAERASNMVFHFTNAVPQFSELNRRSWAQLEQVIYNHIASWKLRAAVFTGPVFGQDDPTYRGYRIPLKFWKIAVFDEGDGKKTVAAFMLGQTISDIATDDSTARGTAESFDPRNSRVGVDTIEGLTGLDFGILRNLNAASL
jgi:endonuclease G, mitochondrial